MITMSNICLAVYELTWIIMNLFAIFVLALMALYLIAALVDVMGTKHENRTREEEEIKIVTYYSGDNKVYYSEPKISIEQPEDKE